MLANVSWSPEVNVALDTLQRSVFVSASGNAEQFSASVQCGYYHHGGAFPITSSLDAYVNRDGDFSCGPFFGHIWNFPHN